ncbi:MAG: phosphate signaling complex protein PhoU [Candidatus Micrarchaeota archaeon]|nr:phosphate signaling complex protein PhoU [Candidatus Micrarchaeota archaeon]
MARSRYSSELDELKREIEKLSDSVCAALDLSISCIVHQRREGQREVLAMHSKIKRHFLQIEKFCMEIIALQQPLASDLRTLIAAFEISRRLERSNDYTAEIATTHLLLKRKILVGLEELQEMEKTAKEATQLSVKGFANWDDSLRKRVWSLERKNDEAFHRLIDRLQQHVQQKPSDGELAIRIYAIGHYYERAADNASRIAKATAYMVSGKRKYLA